MFETLKEEKPVEKKVNQAEVLELAKTRRVATIAETNEYVSKNGGWMRSGTWIDYDGENAVAYHLHSPKEKIKLKLPIKDGECSIPELGIEKIYLLRLKKYSGLLVRDGYFYGRVVDADYGPDDRCGVLVQKNEEAERPTKNSR